MVNKVKKYSFVRFDGTYTRGDSKIGLNKSGLIRLSTGFCKLTNAKSFKYAALFYDSNNKAIAIKFLNKMEDAVLKVTQDGTAATLSALRFINSNKISLKESAGRYSWVKQEIEGTGEVYVFEIK
jgi:hypothetical protein